MQLTLAEIEAASKWMAESKLFGVATWQQAASLMLICQADGIPAPLGVRDYYIIQGRPALKAQAMLDRFLRSGGRITWHERSDTAAEAEFSHPDGGTIRVRWDMDTARRAGLVGRDTWRQYPRQLLHARCISEGVRAVWPGATGGLYTPEEVESIAPAQPVVPAVPKRDWAAEISALSSHDDIQAWREAVKADIAALSPAERDIVITMAVARRRELRAGTKGAVAEAG